MDAGRVGQPAAVGLADHVVEQERATAVEVLLDTGDFQIGIDLCIGFDQIPLLTEKVDRAAQIPERIRNWCWFELFSGCGHARVS